VRHNRAGRLYFMQGKALRMESLRNYEERVDFCLNARPYVVIGEYDVVIKAKMLSMLCTTTSV